MTKILLLAVSLPLFAESPAGFDGRWNLTLSGDPRGRAWWLEVTGAGTAALAGRFVGAPGGQMDAIPKIEIDSGELRWEFERSYAAGAPKSRGRYSARLMPEGILRGSLQVDGESKPRITFAGKRAPVLKDQDDGKWRPGKPVELFNGKDMSGWLCKVPGRSVEWDVAGGVMKNRDKAADITSSAKFWNFDLHVEFKVAHHSNSGIGLRARYEVQVFGDHGEPPSLHGNGALYSRIVPAVNATNAPGDWQVFDIRLIGRTLTVKLNGKTLIDRREVEGLTAMATDPNEDQPGPITLQGDHGPVEFRKITVTPLVR